MVSSFKQLTVNMKSLLDMQLGVGIKTVEDWILNLGAEVYKAQYDQGYYNTGWFNPEMRSRAVF